jgi:hypothetical protein
MGEMKKGWIKIHRELMDHWIYKEDRKFSKLEAWIDLLLSANISSKKILLKGTVYEVEKGESVLSLDSWAKRWNWHKSAVRRFFVLLQNDQMIEIKSDTKVTHISVLKYALYQGFGTESETPVKQTRNNRETILTPTKEYKERKKEKKSNIDGELGSYIDFYNRIFGTKYRGTDQVRNSLERILENYSLEQICQALENSQTSSAWIADKIKSNPLILLRQKNKGGECDYVGELLNSKYKAEYKFQPKAISSELPQQTIQLLNDKFGLPLDWNEYEIPSRSYFIKTHQNKDIKRYFL